MNTDGLQSTAPWALITGASSGIGAALSIEFAAHGWNVALIGRDMAALENVAAAATKLGVSALALKADLATVDGIQHVIAHLNERAIPITALVNNAGFGLHDPFIRSAPEDELRLLDLQLKAMLALTHAVVPGMLERKNGYLLNVSSVYAFSPVANQAVYAACKAFMNSFSRSLALELMGTGVSVSVLCPGITTTKFRSRAGMKEKRSSFALSAEAVARIAFNGMLKRRGTIVPGWYNRLYVSMPASILGVFTRWFNQRRGIAGEAEKKA